MSGVRLTERISVVGDAVLVLDLLLARHDRLADQSAHGVPDLAEVLGVHGAIVASRRDRGRPCRPAHTDQNQVQSTDCTPL